jgi:hypothetical protein
MQCLADALGNLDMVKATNAGLGSASAASAHAFLLCGLVSVYMDVHCRSVPLPRDEVLLGTIDRIQRYKCIDLLHRDIQ